MEEKEEPAPRCSGSRFPGHEIGEQREAGGLAFLWMELHSEIIILRHGAGKGESVDAVAGHQFRTARLDVKAVDKIEAAGGGDAPPQRVRLGLHYFVPAHVRNFELVALRIFHQLRRK